MYQIFMYVLRLYAIKTQKWLVSPSHVSFITAGSYMLTHPAEVLTYIHIYMISVIIVAYA